MTVTVKHIGTRSYTLSIAGRMGGTDIFNADLTPICMARTGHKAVSIPVPLQRRLEQYRDRCAEAAASVVASAAAK